MRPGFIQIGEQYFATIRTDGGAEEVLLDAAGAKVPYESATRAVAAARVILGRRNIEERPAETKEPDLIAGWRRDRAEEQVRLRSEFDLVGVEVVVKRRRPFSKG